MSLIHDVDIQYSLVYIVTTFDKLYECDKLLVVYVFFIHAEIVFHAGSKYPTNMVLIFNIHRSTRLQFLPR